MADPITRQEIYLAYIAGEWNGELPTPVTREEQYLYKIAISGGGGGGGTTNYNALQNKPQINGITLQGNKTGKDLKLMSEGDDMSPTDIEDLINLLG